MREYIIAWVGLTLAIVLIMRGCTQISREIRAEPAPAKLEPSSAQRCFYTCSNAKLVVSKFSPYPWTCECRSPLLGVPK